MTQLRLMTLPQFQASFSVSRSTLYREIWSGRLRLTKIRGASRISHEDAEAWLQRCQSS